jgi:general secretion pathway protein H
MPISATGSRASSFTFLRRSAEHGFTFLRRSAEHGFTLVELLAVLAILAIASATVVLALPARDGGPRTQAERFAAKLSAARDLAIVDGRGVQVMIEPDGYSFAERQDGAWHAIAAHDLRASAWNAGTRARPAATIIFDPAGLADAPPALTLEQDGARVMIALDASGGVRVAP